MAETAKSILARIESLSEKEYAELRKRWDSAGNVKRRWFAFAGGVIVGISGTIAVSMIFGCTSNTASTAPPCPPVTATFCAPGPRVVP